MDIKDFITKVNFKNVTEMGSGRYSACCPAHFDNSNSLSIRQGSDGLIKLFCKAGCTTDAILQKIGVKNTDSKPNAPSKPISPYAKGAFETIDAKTLQDMELPPIKYVLEGLLSSGLHLLAGAPKIGKSWMMLDLCLQVSRGLPIWGRGTLKGSTLYLALEDSMNRLRDRMNKILQGDDAPGNFYYSLNAKPLGNGLIEQIHGHMCKYPDTILIVIDTFQKVRGPGRHDNLYATDYSDASQLKQVADQYGIAILLIHHLRKMGDDDDPLNRVSGTNGLTGAVDTSLVIAKKKRSDSEATLYATGRDIEQFEAIIRFNKESYTWQMVSDSAENFKANEAFHNDATVQFLKGFINENRPIWEGTPTELFQEFMNAGISGDASNYPIGNKMLGKRLQLLANELMKINIKVVYKHGREKRTYGLTLISRAEDAGELALLEDSIS